MCCAQSKANAKEAKRLPTDARNHNWFATAGESAEQLHAAVSVESINTVTTVTSEEVGQHLRIHTDCSECSCTAT